MVLVVTAVIAGAGVALVLGLTLSTSDAIAAASGGVVAIAIMGALLSLDRRRWRMSESELPPLFPTSDRQSSVSGRRL